MTPYQGMLKAMVVLPKYLTEMKSPPLFEGVSEVNLHKILAHSLIREYNALKILVRQGDAPQGLYLIIEGTMKTFRLHEEGSEATIRMLEPGDTCMEAVLFMGGVSPVFVQALTTCKALLIPEKIVREHVLDDAQFSANILRIVTHHYKNAIHQIEAINTKTPIQRVGYYLLAKHLEAGHDNLQMTLPFQKKVIANYLGMTPETFSRTLSQMKTLGVQVEEETFRMKDAYALCHFCDSDTMAVCPRHKDECSACPLH